MTRKPKIKPQLRWAAAHPYDGQPDTIFHWIATRALLRKDYPDRKLMRVLVTAPPKLRKKK